MCGVIAVRGARASPEAVRARIGAGLDALAHRGPDGRGAWLDDGVALGHTRLAVIDLARGAQPIASEDGSVVAVVNGELYDFERQRAELEARGHAFRTGSDSELVVHLYEDHGADLIDHLRGEYAFVIWDRRRRRLVAARDRLGVKPLVYAEHRGELWLASEAKALFAAGVPAVWDDDGIRQALAHQYLGPARTLFRGVRELPPGHRLIADDAGPRVIAPVIEPVELASETELPDVVDGIRTALDDAVRVRLRADVPVAAYLSGGLDSSLTVALAARRGPITAFGIAFDHAPYDEHRRAAAFAAELGIAFHPVAVTQDAILEELPEAVHRAEGLCINGQLTAKFVLSRAVRDAGYKVVLAGEGADEVFYGYDHLVADHRELAAIPAVASERDSIQAGIMLPLARRADLPVWLDAKREIGERMRPLLAPRGVPGHDPIERLFEELGPMPEGPVERAAASWTRLALAKYILHTLGDGTEMAHGVEGRLPFLDRYVVAAARRAAPAHHLEGGVAKRLLRAAARGIVPERIATRPKQPLLAPPITTFATGRSADLCRDVVRGPALRDLPWFDRGAVIAWVDALVATPGAPRAAEPILMTILSACALHHRLHLGVA